MHHLLVNAVESSSIETVIADGTVVVRDGCWALPLNLTARAMKTRSERRRRNQRRGSVATAKSQSETSASVSAGSQSAAETKRTKPRPLATGETVNSNADFGIIDVEIDIESGSTGAAADNSDEVGADDEIEAEADPDAWADDAVPTEAQMAAYVTALRYRVYERVVNGALQSVQCVLCVCFSVLVCVRGRSGLLCCYNDISSRSQSHHPNL